MPLESIGFAITFLRAKKFAPSLPRYVVRILPFQTTLIALNRAQNGQFDEKCPREYILDRLF